VVAGGGGGVPIDEDGRPLDCVVDKDWVASLLAVALDAQHLVFATDVECVYDGYDRADARALGTLAVRQARAMIDDGTAAPGSMAPKLASAADYVVATGRSAYICGLTGVVEAVSGAARAGTLIAP
jgi:carbamate kinase